LQCFRNEYEIFLKRKDFNLQTLCVEKCSQSEKRSLICWKRFVSDWKKTRANFFYHFIFRFKRIVNVYFKNLNFRIIFFKKCQKQKILGVTHGPPCTLANYNWTLPWRVISRLHTRAKLALNLTKSGYMYFQRKSNTFGIAIIYSPIATGAYSPKQSFKPPDLKYETLEISWSSFHLSVFCSVL